MTKPLVSVIILTYNSRRHLSSLLASLAEQTYQPLEIIVVDNASQDGSVEWLNSQKIIPIQLVSNQENVWFARGNNQGIALAKGEYLYICNDDIVLTPSYLERLVQRMQSNSNIAMVGGKLLKLMDGKPSTIIDSAGLQLRRWGQVTNRGEQTADTGQYQRAEPIFGITGAGMLLRRSALEVVKHGQQEYFDADFVAYKEDIDLSWRLHRAQFTVWYEPAAVAYHARSIQHTTLSARKEKSALIRAMSYRNHWWALIKNLSMIEWCLRLPWLLPYECAKLAYALVCEWSTLRMIPETVRGIPTMLRKRHGKL